jgi:hypothetical protein
VHQAEQKQGVTRGKPGNFARGAGNDGGGAGLRGEIRLIHFIRFIRFIRLKWGGG